MRNVFLFLNVYIFIVTVIVIFLNRPILKIKFENILIDFSEYFKILKMCNKNMTNFLTSKYVISIFKL